MRLLQSLGTSTTAPLDIILAADRCTDGSQAAVAQRYPQVQITETSDRPGVAGARALGARLARGDYLFFVDDDNVVDAGCVAALADALACNPRLGVVGPVSMRYPDGSGVWCAGAFVGTLGLVHHAVRLPSQRVGAPPRAFVPCDFIPNAFCVRREVLHQVPFDTRTFPGNWTEPDFCFRVKHTGYDVGIAVPARVWHDAGYRSRTTRLHLDHIDNQARARVLFRRRFRAECGSLWLFWLVVFPLSTLYYFARFAAAGHAWSRIKGYVRGTVAGAREPCDTSPLPKVR